MVKLVKIKRDLLDSDGEAVVMSEGVVCELRLGDHGPTTTYCGADYILNEDEYEELPEEEQKMIVVRCQHMAEVNGPNSCHHLVIFQPQRETVQAVYRWRDARDARGVHCEDNAGTHVKRQKEYVVKVVYDYDCMIVTTHLQP